MPIYTIARTGHGRPTLQHILTDSYDKTACGLDISTWSRSYQKYALSEILCKSCARVVN